MTGDWWDLLSHPRRYCHHRRWAGPLTLTPCDLWEFMGPANGHPGRTLWVIGDSQAGAAALPGLGVLQKRTLHMQEIIRILLCSC